jgi:hypothetical protein
MPLVRLALILVAAIIGGSAVALAQDDPYPGLYEPDHLVPPRGGPVDLESPYRKALRRYLKLDASFFARMVSNCDPGEICLRLHGPDGVSDISKTKKFFLTSYEANKSIWESIQERGVYRKPGEILVTVSSAPVPEAFAKRLRDIWDQMLSRVRPPEKPNNGFDGTTYEFATPERLGTTWSPMKRLSPRLMVEFSWSLAAYCKVKPDRRPVLRRELEQQMAILENYLRENPAP